MLLITQGMQEWRTEIVRAVHRAAPGPGELPAIAATGVGGTIVWTPPRPALVRAVVATVDVGDPLVIASGAPTTVQLGLQVGTGATGFAGLTLFTVAASLGAWNTAGGRILGWGNAGPRADTTTTSLNNAVASGGVFVTPVDSVFSGELNLARSLAAGTDTGTVTGTMLWCFQWRPIL